MTGEENLELHHSSNATLGTEAESGAKVGVISGPGRITERPHLSKEALLSLTSLVSSPPGSEDHVHDNLLQTAVGECEGGCRDATNVSGLADLKRKRSRADGRSGTRRSDRSHGPRSGGGLSRGGRKS